MTLEALWEIAKNLGPGGAVLLLILRLAERREVQKMVERLNRENMERFEVLFERLTTSPAEDVRGPSTARSETVRRGGGTSGRE